MVLITINSILQSVSHWLGSTAFHALGAPVSNAEVIGFVTGALCVWLVARQHVLNWPIGITNNLVWILLFAEAGLFADSMLQVVYIALAVFGWWTWTTRGRTDSLPVSRTPASQAVALTVVGIGGTALITWFLAVATPSTVPFWDAVTTVLSLLATWGQAYKKLSSWWLWIAADLVYIPLYLHKDLVLTAILYLGFLALCVRGLWLWRFDLLRTERLTAGGTASLTGAPA
jgi:nicotinamide mononucleotide transporter